MSSSVTTLILDDNQNLTSVGLLSLIEIAAQNTLLRKIFVRNCNISYSDEDDDEILKQSTLIEAISHNCSITEIDFTGNEVPEEMQRQINDELEKNKDIVETIFPIIKKRELYFLKEKVKEIRQQNKN